MRVFICRELTVELMSKFVQAHIAPAEVDDIFTTMKEAEEVYFCFDQSKGEPTIGQNEARLALESTLGKRPKWDYNQVIQLDRDDLIILTMGTDNWNDLLYPHDKPERTRLPVQSRKIVVL